MKRITSFVLVLAMAAIFFTGCQKNKNVSIDVNALANSLKSTVSFTDDLSEPNEAAFSRTYEINAADIAKKKIYVSSGATAEEIAVFEAANKDAAARIRTAVDNRVQEQLTDFKDYNPEEQKKLSDPVIVQTGNYVILCVSDYNDTAEKCIKDYTK